MDEFTVTTGMGYIEDASGNVVAKCELPPGKHPLKPGYTYVEVGSREELDAVTVHSPALSPEDERERKILLEMRAMAEERLVQRGELPPHKP